jgi:hypothetical protein
MKFFWSNGNWMQHQSAYGYLALRSWFVSRHSRFVEQTELFEVILSKGLYKLLFDVIKPKNVGMSLDGPGPLVSMLCSLYDCKFIRTPYLIRYYLVSYINYPGIMSLINKPSGKQISKKIERMSSYLTIVPYLEQISQFKDITFPRIKTLVFLQTESVNLNFLKCELFLKKYI